MAKKKVKNKVSDKVSSEKVSPRVENRNSLATRFGLADSYISLILGVAVVVVIAVILLLIVSGRNKLKTVDFASIRTQLQEQLSGNDKKTTQAPVADEGVHTVVDGDSLWTIAEKHYKSGEKWVEIARANNLTNPNWVAVGSKLDLPNLEERKDQKTYTVKPGDSLWSISVATYADGYRWSEIAGVNGLTNPDWINPGTVLNLP